MDVFIPGYSVLEIGAVLQGKADGRSIMVERKELREPLVLLAVCIVEPIGGTEPYSASKTNELIRGYDCL